MIQKAILICGDDIWIFPSHVGISSYLEFDSFDGDEKAFLENGEKLNLSIELGRRYRGLLGEEKILSDYKYVNASSTGDFSEMRTLVSSLKFALKKLHVGTDGISESQKLVELLLSEVGFS